MKLENTSLKCLNCGAENWHEDSLAWQCNECQTTYPVLGNTPVLMPNPKAYLVNVYLQYLSYINRKKEELKAFSGHKGALMQAALAKNISFIESITSTIEQHIGIRDVQLGQATEGMGYLFNFEYLKRDWSTCEEDEAEIALVMRYLASSKQYLADNDSCLLLGAGAGRFVQELAPSFDQVYANDLSLTMLQFYDQLHDHGIDFSIINHKNSVTTDGQIRSFSAAPIANRNENALFHVGDVHHMPYQDHTMSCVYSVYFTDVLPLRNYFSEVLRVLKPGGLFVHFGPLEYHFADESQMFSTVELKEFFAENDLELLEEDFVSSFHKVNQDSLMKKEYNNWYLVLRKKIKEKRHYLASTVLRVKSTLYHISKDVQSAEGISTEHLLEFENGSRFEGAYAVSLLLKLIDGQLDLQTISKTMAALLEDDSIVLESLIPFLEMLEEEGVEFESVN